MIITDFEHVEIKETKDVDMIVKQNKNKNEYVVHLDGKKKVHHENSGQEMIKDNIIIDSIAEYMNEHPNTKANFKLKGCADFVKDYLYVKEVSRDATTISYSCKVRGFARTSRFLGLSRYLDRLTIVAKK